MVYPPEYLLGAATMIHGTHWTLVRRRFRGSHIFTSHEAVAFSYVASMMVFGQLHLLSLLYGPLFIPVHSDQCIIAYVRATVKAVGLPAARTQWSPAEWAPDILLRIYSYTGCCSHIAQFIPSHSYDKWYKFGDFCYLC